MSQRTLIPLLVAAALAGPGASWSQSPDGEPGTTPVGAPQPADADGAFTAAGAVEESPGVTAYREALARLAWIKGPTEVAIAGNSKLAVPAGYLFLEPGETTKYLEMNQNLGSGREVLIAPESLEWEAYLEFDDSGYVKDDEKIDAPALLASMKEGNAQSNEERRRRGWTEVNLVDWASPPVYNTATKRLEWATLLESQGGRSVNFSTKVLGRRGHTSVILVTEPAGLPVAQQALTGLLDGYRFDAGNTYAEWVPGDKVAEYGLAALVLGGAAAVATKKGLWAVLAGFLGAAWKFLAAGVVGLGGWLRSRMRKKADGAG